MNALILAAGYATRLYPLTLDKAKPLLTVGGKPIIEWATDNLAAVPNLELLARFPGVLKVPIRVDDRGRFSLNMERNLCILVEPDHDPIPYLRSGELACMQVERLIILEVNGFGL